MMRLTRKLATRPGPSYVCPLKMQTVFLSYPILLPLSEKIYIKIKPSYNVKNKLISRHTRVKLSSEIEFVNDARTNLGGNIRGVFGPDEKQKK